MSLLSACTLVACSEQTVIAPAAHSVTSVVAADHPDASLLSSAGILALAAQLIATSGETPMIAQAWQASEHVQPNGYNLDAIWADPVSGKGWAMYDNHGPNLATNHFWITTFTWPVTTTDYTVVQQALQAAIVDAVNGTRTRTSVDDFGRRANATGLSGVEELVWNAAYNNDGPSNVTITAERTTESVSAGFTPGHTVKLIEMWVTLDKVMFAPGRFENRAHGTYLMSVDSKRSTHAFCFANTEDISFDFGAHAGIDLMHNAEKSLGLPLDPFTQTVVVGDTVELNKCPN
jgi:hypothetical protein